MRHQDPQALVQALQSWAGVDQPLQRQALPALGEHDLTPLRQRATVCASIAQATQQALASGIERRSEALESALGLVRADDFSHLREQVASPSQSTLAADLHHLAPDLLMTHFPREADGRLPLGCTVLLASYDAAQPQRRNRQLWLAACAPQRRRDPQVVTLTLASLIGVNHAWRWDQARWFWDDQHQAASTEERWGVSGLTVERLGIKNRAEHVAFFAERCAQPHPSRADQVGLCLLLQDEGRLEEAFTLFGVELSAEVLNILYAQPLSLNTSYNIESWSSTLRSMLTSAAPWRFADLPAGTHHRLCALPHQTQQSKACLIIAMPKAREMAGTPCLFIKNTASNKLLPHVAWRRPLDLDLMRFQLQ